MEEFINNSVYSFYRLNNEARQFLHLIDEAISHCSESNSEDELPTTDVIFQLQERHRDFETALRLEFSSTNLYLVQHKSAFDTVAFIEFGEAAFPANLRAKASEAINDLRQAMRCIVFELPTASAFHLHRANEVVMGKYWDAVTEGKDRPRTRILDRTSERLRPTRLANLQ